MNEWPLLLWAVLFQSLTTAAVDHCCYCFSVSPLPSSDVCGGCLNALFKDRKCSINDITPCLDRDFTLTPWSDCTFWVICWDQWTSLLRRITSSLNSIWIKPPQTCRCLWYSCFLKIPLIILLHNIGWIVSVNGSVFVPETHDNTIWFHNIFCIIFSSWVRRLEEPKELNLMKTTLN